MKEPKHRIQIQVSQYMTLGGMSQAAAVRQVKAAHLGRLDWLIDSLYK